MIVFKNTTLIHVLVTGYGHENKIVKNTMLKAHMQAELTLQLKGRICLNNVSKMGINESIRYVVLIVLKPTTAATALGSLWSDEVLLLRSPGSCGFAGGSRGRAGPPAMELKFSKAVVPNIPTKDVKVWAEVMTATNEEYHRPEGNCNPTN